MKKEIPKISPLIEKWHPDASEDEKKLYTEELRAFLKACVELCDADEKRGSVSDK